MRIIDPSVGQVWCGYGRALDSRVVVVWVGKRITLERLTGEAAGHRIRVTPMQLHAAFQLDWRVGCIVCGKLGHPANMVNVYDGEHECQECRWGL